MSKSKKKIMKEMDKKQLTEILKKYDLSKKNLKQILEHLTYFKEHIDATVPTKFGDSIDLNIFVEFIFDDVKYDIGFYVDYSGNAGSWCWEDGYQAEDEDELQFILRMAICQYLDAHYSQHFF